MATDTNLSFLTRYLTKSIARDSLDAHYSELHDLLLTLADLDSLSASYLDLFYLMNLLSFYDIQDEELLKLINGVKIKILRESGELDITDIMSQPSNSTYHSTFFE